MVLLSLVLATKNQGKWKELDRLIRESDAPIALSLCGAMPEVDETGTTFIENARLKAMSGSEAQEFIPPDSYVLGEDSGLIVDALDGKYDISPFPGIFSNRWMTPAIREALLQKTFPNQAPLERTTKEGISNRDLCHGILTLMQGESVRTARYCCAMALWHLQHGLCFETEGNVMLRVMDETHPRGTEGFGYDPIMIPIDLPAVNQDEKKNDRTMAELSMDEKNQISHRSQAFNQVLHYLSGLI